jgi:uncharacterized protein YbjT (DUF2867 family)
MGNQILVVGGTGMLGKPVVKNLINNGFEIRVLTRSKEKARGLFDERVEIFEGNVNVPNNVSKALEGCFGVHINLSGEEELSGALNVIKTAKSKGLERITYISGTNVKIDEKNTPRIIQRKAEVEKAITESGIPYTIFRPTWFMETLGNFVKGSRAFLIGKPKVPLHFVAARDYAQMVSAAYKREEAKNKTFYVHGPEAIPFQDALEKYCNARAPFIKKIFHMPYGLMEFIAFAKRNSTLKEIIELLRFFEKAGERGNPEETNKILGKATTTLETWLHEEASGEKI